MHWRRKWQPTPVFLPGESQGWGHRELQHEAVELREIKNYLLSLFLGRRSSILRNGRIEVNVGILTNILQKSSFTHIKQTHHPEVLGDEQGSQFCQRRLKFSRRMIMTLYSCLPETQREERFLQKLLQKSVSLSWIDASCSACLWKYNLFHCRLKTEDLAYLSGPSIELYTDHSLHRNLVLKVTSPTSTLAWKLSNKAHFQAEFLLVGSWWNTRAHMWVSL